jgi:hypothetical protein
MAEDEYEVSTKSASTERAKIRPGMYAGQLTAIKTKNKDGNPIENKFGPQAILEFAVYHVDDNDNVTKHVEFKTSAGDMQPVFLAQFLNVAYRKTTKENVPVLGSDGKQVIQSAFTPASRSTRVLMALGWTGPREGEKLKLSEFVGSWAMLFVKDYEKDGKVFSTIFEVTPFKGVAPQAATGKVAAVSEEVVSSSPSAFETRANDLKKKLDDGFITQRGYDTAIASLRAEYGQN